MAMDAALELWTGSCIFVNTEGRCSGTILGLKVLPQAFVCLHIFELQGGGHREIRQTSCLL